MGVRSSFSLAMVTALSFYQIKSQEACRATYPLHSGSFQFLHIPAHTLVLHFASQWHKHSEIQSITPLLKHMRISHTHAHTYRAKGATVDLL